MVVHSQDDFSELASLMAGLTKVGVVDTRKHATAATVSHAASLSAAPADPASSVQELQHACRTFIRYVLMTRPQTDHLQSILRTAFTSNLENTSP